MNEREIFLKTESWLKQNLDVAIAYVVQTWGSSPRPVGSAMVINNNNETIGSVSGGCIESFVFGKAIEVIKSDVSQVLEFGVSNKQAWDVGLTCGGKIKIFVEKINKKNINEIKLINKTIKTNKKIVIATNLKNQDKIVYEDINSYSNDNLLDEVKETARKKTSSLKLVKNSPWFFKFFGGKYKIIIIGAVHIAEPLILMAKILDFEIILIDPRNNYDDKKFVSDALILKEWPDDALKKIELNNSCSVVTLTHDPKLDDPALEYILNKDLLYIGSLGSKKTHASRKIRLMKKGFSEEKIQRIKGPIGLDIGAMNPAEIATSIISQIISIKNMS